jgi:spore coat protein U-like protein
MERSVSSATPWHFSIAVNGSSTKDVEIGSRSRVMEAADSPRQVDVASPRPLAQLPWQGRELVKRKSARVAALAAVGLAVGSGAVSAGTSTGTLPVQVTIVSDCKVKSALLLDFGSQGVLDTARTGATTIGIQCTNTTPYNVRLNAGSGAGATIANRRMTLGAATVTYSLYRDAAHALVWGVTDGTDTVAGTGNGAVQTLDVYGQIPAQATPAPGAYTDTVTVTVAW